MNVDPPPERQFGCERCYGTDAETSWKYFRSGCEHDGNLVEDSHFIVGLRRCRACSQRFVNVFTEFIDWHGGEDPQYVTIMPLTDAEADALLDGSLDVHDVGGLGRDRRHLKSDWPSGAPARRHWSRGTFAVVEGY
jgi:hypothetical protein